MRNFVLNQRGIDSTKEFIERQQKFDGRRRLRRLTARPRQASTMDLLLIGGVSGSGKSVALAALEDSGYYAVNNLPLPLRRRDGATISRDAGRDRVAIALDVKTGRGLPACPVTIARLHGARLERALPLPRREDARRWSSAFPETRRRHPFSSDDAHADRGDRVRARACSPTRVRSASRSTRATCRRRRCAHWIKDFVSVDASRLTLLLRIVRLQARRAARRATSSSTCAACPIPHYEPALQALTGRDPPVVRFLERFPEVERMYADIYHFVASWLPDYARDNRNYLTVAIGCTGGARIARCTSSERLARAFSPRYQVLTRPSTRKRASDRHSGARFRRPATFTATAHEASCSAHASRSPSRALPECPTACGCSNACSPADVPCVARLFVGGADRREAGVRSRAADAAARGDAPLAERFRRARRPAHRVRPRGLDGARSRRARTPPTRWRSARARMGTLGAIAGRSRRQPDRARRRRHAEGAAPARARAARDAAVGDPPRQHAEARARRRRDPAAVAGFLRSPATRSPTSSTSSSRACSISSASRTSLGPRWGEDRDRRSSAGTQSWH